MQRVMASFLMLLMSLVIATGARAEEESNNPQVKSGAIRGVVVDQETQSPLPGVSVQLIGSDKGAATNDKGEFRISNLPVGSYAVRFSSIGYEPVTRTDVIVRTGRVTVVEAALTFGATEVAGISVNAGYFSDAPTEPTSSTAFSAEEIRRSPGSAGDVSRIMFTLPSIAKVNDNVNNLIVRGGSPTENSFYVDNIEIPNINHYPLFGTSGGPISLVNTDFIQDVTFSAGGFSASYGDRLSSVMDINFRQGNREEFDLQADFNFAGVGLVAEGPLGHNRGAWLVSVRRSYLDLLVDAIGVGVVPKYSDYQAKLTYDLSGSQRLSVLGIAGIDKINFTREDAIDEGNVTDGWSDGYEYAFGANLRSLWGSRGYSNSSVSMLGTKTKSNYFETSTGNELVRENNLDGALQMRNVNHVQLAERHDVEFGFDLRYEIDDYDYWASSYTNYIGDTIPSLTLKRKIESPKVGGFASYIVHLGKAMTATLGGRFDYFEYTGNSSFAPRTALAYRLSNRTTLTGAFGVYYQTVPIVLLSQQESNRELSDPRAYHYVLGLDQMLTENSRLRIEGYYKQYEHFPMNVDQPKLFIIDEMIYSNYFQYQPNLVDDGKARSYGVEMTLQKKLKAGVYGLLSGAWFRSQYRDLQGTWRNRSFDNQVVVSAEGGYKPNNKWEYSLRWVFAGGAPYTPLNVEASEDINRSVYDESRINESRYPAYHSLNLRVDRRYNFRNSNLIVYVSVWNAYNRENVANYYWNEIEKKQDEILQWSLLPVFGVEFEF